MAKVNHSRNNRRLHMKRHYVVFVSIAVLLLGMVGGTLAYLLTNTNPVLNEFTHGKVPPGINEEFDGEIKKNVTITNNGNIPAYIRAAVIINWMDGEYIVAEPDDHEFTCQIITSDDGWFDGGDGYYYYKQIVPSGKTTSALIGEAKPTAGTQYQLRIDVVAQTVQTVPANVVADQWGVTVAPDGTISK